MRKNTSWIMTDSELEEFEKYKLEKYKSNGVRGQVDDDVLTKYYTYFIIHFFRKLKISKENLFKA